MKKRNITLVFMGVSLLLIVCGIYLSIEDSNKSLPIEYSSYHIGDKVNVKLNSELVKSFYVIADSEKSDSSVTLIADESIGFGPFNSEDKKNAVYKDSLIEKKLNDLTKEWTNVTSKRLITYDELINTGETETKEFDSCDEDGCQKLKLTFIKSSSWLIKDKTDFWTMTEFPSDEDISSVAYIVNGISGEIYVSTTYLTDDASEEDFNTFGIKPVIVIKKDFIVE